MWFKKLTGFDEISPDYVRENLYLKGKNIISKINDRSFQFGSLEVSSLSNLQGLATPLELLNDKILINEVVADVQDLHCDPANRNALFQAASQFNLLEMVAPTVTPESGIDIYDRDFTQGPACAIACGAGTIYRNYFAPVNGRIGQSHHNQIDCLYDVGNALGNEERKLWTMSNGYALLNLAGLNINSQLSKLSNDKREELKGKLKIGIQWDTEVTLNADRQIVSQAYCSALPVTYSNLDSIYWESFAILILEATYEATLYAALMNFKKTGSKKVFLTLVGGGAFGNRVEWISDALIRTLKKFKYAPLDIKIVSHRCSNPRILALKEMI